MASPWSFEDLVEQSDPDRTSAQVANRDLSTQPGGHSGLSHPTTHLSGGDLPLSGEYVITIEGESSDDLPQNWDESAHSTCQTKSKASVMLSTERDDSASTERPAETPVEVESRGMNSVISIESEKSDAAAQPSLEIPSSGKDRGSKDSVVVSIERDDSVSKKRAAATPHEEETAKKSKRAKTREEPTEYNQDAYDNLKDRANARVKEERQQCKWERERSRKMEEDRDDWRLKALHYQGKLEAQGGGKKGKVKSESEQLKTLQSSITKLMKLEYNALLKEKMNLFESKHKNQIVFRDRVIAEKKDKLNNILEDLRAQKAKSQNEVRHLKEEINVQGKEGNPKAREAVKEKEKNIKELHKELESRDEIERGLHNKIDKMNHMIKAAQHETKVLQDSYNNVCIDWQKAERTSEDWSGRYAQLEQKLQKAHDVGILHHKNSEENAHRAIQFRRAVNDLSRANQTITKNLQAARAEIEQLRKELLEVKSTRSEIHSRSTTFRGAFAKNDISPEEALEIAASQRAESAAVEDTEPPTKVDSPIMDMSSPADVREDVEVHSATCPNTWCGGKE